MSLTRREAFTRLFEHMVDHDGNGGHGYSQAARQGDGSVESVDLGGGVTVRVAGGDRDCSSAVITCLKAVGVDTYVATYTGNMRGELTRGGVFRVASVSEAGRGDIYLNDLCHTAVCLGGGKLAEFSISETGGVTGKVGDQTGWESHRRAFYTYSRGWDCCLKWTGDGGNVAGSSSGAGSAPAAQGANLLMDCDLGVLTLQAWAQQLGLTGTAADGWLSHQHPRNKAYLRNFSSVEWNWYKGCSKSPMAVAIQERIGSANVDGVLGQVDVQNLQKYMNETWGYHMDPDGYAWDTTAYNLQHSLNLGLWGR